MSLGIRAIKPHPEKLIDTRKAIINLDNDLRNLAYACVNELADYPTQEPTTYVRSGNLGRGWKVEPEGHGSVKIVNRTVSSSSRYRTKTKGVVVRHHAPRAYAVYVQGSRDTTPGQAGVMADKGWESIDDVVERHLDRDSGIIIRHLQGE